MNEISAQIQHYSKLVQSVRKSNSRMYSLDDIAVRVCHVLDMDVKLVHKKSRITKIIFARQLSHAIAYIFSITNGWTLNDIGEAIGGKDHSTVLHSIKVISNYIETNYKLQEINKVLDYFNILPHKLIYTPFASHNDLLVKIFIGNALYGKYANVRTAAKSISVSVRDIIKADGSGDKINNKYTINIIK